MCSVDKMLIKGIRSFSPDNDHAIIFPKPLTLIVGRNGAGKTTVIECLKMATTGELPPSARAGQAFIHDPKVADVTEVKAQIKLRFRDVRAQPCVVTRSFQLAQKSGGKLEKKDLDQAIQTIDEKTGEKVSVSRKCADINATVPDMMGVSKAILENVVFVHQEDSNWPLGEAATLKKKFDEIFSATKYTKALEHIGRLRKEQAAAIKEHKLRVENLRLQKDHASKLKDRHDDARDKATALGSRMKELQGKIDECNSAVTAAGGDIHELRSLSEKIGQLEARREAIVTENSRKHANLGTYEMTDPTEVLEKSAEDFAAQVSSLKRLLEECERKSGDLSLEIANFTERREKELRTVTKLGAESDAQQRRLRERAETLLDLCARYPDLGPAPRELTDAAKGSIDADAGDDPTRDAVKKVRANIAAKLVGLRAAADALRAKHSAEDDERTAAADAAARKLAAKEEAVRVRSERRDSRRRRAEQISAEIAACALSDRAVDDLNARLVQQRTAFEDKQRDATSSTIADDLDIKRRELEDLDRNLRRLRSEQDRAAAAGESALKLRLRREELFSAQERLAALLAAKKPAMREIFGNDADDFTGFTSGASVRDAVREMRELTGGELDRARVASVAADAALDAAAKASDVARGNRARLGAEVDELESRADELDELLPRDASADSRFAGYDRVLADADAAVAEADAMLAEAENMSKVFGTFARNAEQQRCCALCAREFETDGGLADFRAGLDERLRQLPDRVDGLKTSRENARQKRAAIHALGPAASRYRTLVDAVLPESDAMLSEALAAVEEARVWSAAAAADVTVAEAKHARMTALTDDADAITALWRETDAARSALEELERSMGIAPSQQTQGGQSQPRGEARTVSSIAADIEDCEIARSAAEKDLDLLGRRKERMDRDILDAERELAATREEHVRTQAKVERRAELGRELAEIETEEKEAAVDEARRAAECAPAEAERERLAALREEARAKARAVEAVADDTTRALQREVDAMDAADKPIEGYYARAVAAQLTRAKAELDDAEGKLESLRTEFAEIEKKGKKHGELMSQQESLKRSLDDNIAFRKGKEEADRLAKEIERLNSQVRSRAGNLADFERVYKRKTEARSVNVCDSPLTVSCSITFRQKTLVRLTRRSPVH